MSHPITRIGKVGILGHLDELEQLSKEYCATVDDFQESTALLRRLSLSGFIVWLRQRQRQSVANARPMRNLSDVTRELDQQR